MFDWQNICKWSMFHSYVSLLEVSFWLQKEIAYPIFSKASHTDGFAFWYILMARRWRLYLLLQQQTLALSWVRYLALAMPWDLAPGLEKLVAISRILRTERVGAGTLGLGPGDVISKFSKTVLVHWHIWTCSPPQLPKLVLLVDNSCGSNTLIKQHQMHRKWPLLFKVY